MATVKRVLKKWKFTNVIGAVDGKPRNPKPNGIEYILEEQGISKSEAVYIGDMKVDIETAKNADVYGIFCEWGFGEVETLELEPSLIVKKPKEILEIF